MKDKTILITGSRGFIGQRLAAELRAAQVNVWGTDLGASSELNYLQANLLDSEEVSRVFARAPEFSAVVHLAALAHGQKPRPPATCYSVNTGITGNLLDLLRETSCHFIFFSSVAVYGEDGRNCPVSIDADNRPATEYGKSKLRCEEMLLNSGLQHIDVLRLAPVFDEAHLDDVKKRVYAGPLPLRMRVVPSPRYSLCHSDTAVRKVIQIIQRGPNGRCWHHVADPEPYDQGVLANWFSGPSFPVSVTITKPVYLLCKLLRGSTGYALRCAYWKLFRSNVYASCERLEPARRIKHDF